MSLFPCRLDLSSSENGALSPLSHVYIVLNEEVLVVAEGERVRQYPREVPRGGPVSAHRGTGGESLSIRGRNQPSIYTCTEPVM